jgi:hypothetical protein
MPKTRKVNRVALTVDNKALRLIKKMEEREDIYVEVTDVQSGYVMEAES